MHYMDQAWGWQKGGFAESNFFSGCVETQKKIWICRTTIFQSEKKSNFAEPLFSYIPEKRLVYIKYKPTCFLRLQTERNPSLQNHFSPTWKKSNFLATSKSFLRLQIKRDSAFNTQLSITVPDRWRPVDLTCWNLILRSFSAPVKIVYVLPLLLWYHVLQQPSWVKSQQIN